MTSGRDLLHWKHRSNDMATNRDGLSQKAFSSGLNGKLGVGGPGERISYQKEAKETEGTEFLEGRMYLGTRKEWKGRGREGQGPGESGEVSRGQTTEVPLGRGTLDDPVEENRPKN